MKLRLVIASKLFCQNSTRHNQTGTNNCIEYNLILQLQAAHVTKLVQRGEINVPINLTEIADANLLSQVPIVIAVVLDIGELDKINQAAKVSFKLPCRNILLQIFKNTCLKSQIYIIYRMCTIISIQYSNSIFFFLHFSLRVIL